MEKEVKFGDYLRTVSDNCDKIIKLQNNLLSEAKKGERNLRIEMKWEEIYELWCDENNIVCGIELMGDNVARYNFQW